MIGARLTGAGFGGCVVALVERGHALAGRPDRVARHPLRRSPNPRRGRQRAPIGSACGRRERWTTWPSSASSSRRSGSRISAAGCSVPSPTTPDRRPCSSSPPAGPVPPGRRRRPCPTRSTIASPRSSPRSQARTSRLGASCASGLIDALARRRRGGAARRTLLRRQRTAGPDRRRRPAVGRGDGWCRGPRRPDPGGRSRPHRAVGGGHGRRRGRGGLRDGPLDPAVGRSRGLDLRTPPPSGPRRRRDRGLVGTGRGAHGLLQHVLGQHGEPRRRRAASASDRSGTGGSSAAPDHIRSRSCCFLASNSAWVRAPCWRSWSSLRDLVGDGLRRRPPGPIG